MTTTWPAATLAAIDAADDLKVSPLRPDGSTYGTPTWIWCVVVDGELYVRAYHGDASRWFAAATARPQGRIHAAGEVHDVIFEPTAPERDEAIDDAYRAKYAGNAFLTAMTTGRARTAGFRLRPR